ncbi:hypothetical protein Tco_0646523 [Tanacetum coccineum]
MTKVIKGEFEKLETLRINDVSLTCDTSLEIFHDEFNRLSKIDEDLFTYEVEITGIANIPCDLNKDDDSEQRMSHESDDDMEYDPSNVEFTGWLASNFFNYKTMDHYTKRALWIYWLRGDDEVEITDEESSDSDEEEEVAEIFRIETNVFDFETPLCRAFNEFNYLLKVDPEIFTYDIERMENYDDYINEFNDEFEEPWDEDGFCNGGKLPGMVRVGYMTYFQDHEWYNDLMDGSLKNEALEQKAIYEESWGDAKQSVIHFCGWLKETFGNFHELDYGLLEKL